MAGGRNLHPSQGVEVSLSGGGFNGQHVGLHNEVQGMAKQQPGFPQSAQPEHTQAPDVVTVDKNAAYPVAMETSRVMKR